MPPKKLKLKSQVTKTKQKKTSEQSRQMIKRQVIVGSLLVVFISALITSIYYVTRIESLQIKEIKIIGGETIPHAQVEELTAEILSGTYLRLVPKSFKLTLPESEISAYIKTIDRVNNVKVELNKDTVVVVYDEFIPVALWCETREEKSCLFLDKNGYAFSMAPTLEGSAFVRVVETGMVPEKYKTNFSADWLTSNQIFMDKLETELGLYVTHIEKVGDYDVEYIVSGGGKIKTSQTVELDKSFRNLRTVLQSEDFAHIGPGKFQYIDLRFGDKVFVNEEFPVESVSTSTENLTE